MFSIHLHFFKLYTTGLQMYKSLFLLLFSSTITYGMENLQFPSNRRGIVQEIINEDGFFGSIGPVDPLTGRILSDNATPQEQDHFLKRITQELKRLDRDRENRKIHTSRDNATKLINAIYKIAGKEEGSFGSIGPVDPLTGRILSDNATPQEQAHFLKKINRELERLDRNRENREIRKGKYR